MKIIFLTILCIICFQCASENLFAAEKPLIRFGVIPRYNPLVMYKRYQPIMDYLTAETPYRFELKISKDYPEAVRFLQQDVVDSIRKCTT